MQSAIRKAAVLFSSLDPASAEALLAQLDAQTARRIREAARTLRVVNPKEQQEVLEEFFAKDEREHAGRSSPAPAERLASSAEDEVVFEHREPAPVARRPFQFLENVDPGQLAARLASEHPQTIAIVAANAPRGLAAELLIRLPAALRSDVLVRVIDWSPTEPQLVQELEQALELSLAATANTPAPVAGLDAVREILDAAGAGRRTELLNDLAARDSIKADLLRQQTKEDFAPPETNPRDVLSAAKSRPPRSSDAGEPDDPPATIPFAPSKRGQKRPLAAVRAAIPFAEFVSFDDRTLVRVFASADPQSALLALIGAPPQLVNRLMRRLSRKDAARLRRRMETVGPFRLKDIETAQQALAHLAGNLVVAAKRKAA